VDNAHILEEVYFLPYAEVLLRHLALQTVVLVMDGRGVGRGCTVLMIHVVYKGRALPLAWGRISQLGEGWHSNGNALRFGSDSLGAPKEESSRCYA
jgi:hypothetical protein